MHLCATASELYPLRLRSCIMRLRNLHVSHASLQRSAMRVVEEQCSVDAAWEQKLQGIEISFEPRTVEGLISV
jgi:hypothetical protein